VACSPHQRLPSRIWATGLQFGAVCRTCLRAFCTTSQNLQGCTSTPKAMMSFTPKIRCLPFTHATRASAQFICLDAIPSLMHSWGKSSPKMRKVLKSCSIAVKLACGYLSIERKVSPTAGRGVLIHALLTNLLLSAGWERRWLTVANDFEPLCVQGYDDCAYGHEDGSHDGA